MRVCVRVFSVGFGPGLDSMSPARSRRSASHVAGTHGWLPQKTGRPGLRRGGVGGYNLQCSPEQSPRLWHTNHEQAVSVWCNASFKRLYQCQSKIFSTFLSKITKYNRVPLGFDPSVAQLLGHDPTPRPLVR